MSKEKILIIDDDADLTEVMAEILSLHEFEIDTLNSLKNLESMLASKQHDLIITDMNLGKESGVQLVDAVEKRKDQTPILIMTGFPESDEVRQLMYRDYVSGLLIKPFSENDILTNVRLAIHNSQTHTDKKIAPFLAVPLSMIQVDTDLPFEVFLKIYEGKYVKIAHSKSRLSEDKVKALDEKKITSVFVPFEQFPDVLKLNVDYLKHSREIGKELGARDKSLMYLSGQPLIEQFSNLNMDKETFDEVSGYVSICVHYASKYEDLFTDLERMQKESPEKYFRVISTSFLGCAYAILTEKFSKDEVMHIGMGSLLMNIGESHLPEELLGKTFSMMTMAERQTFKTHPDLGVEALKEIPSVPPDVLTIVAQHHERFDGKGFPKKLAGRQIDPLASIVSAARELSCCLYPSPTTTIDVSTGVSRFKENSQGAVSAKLISNFGEVFSTLSQVSK